MKKKVGLTQKRKKFQSYIQITIFLHSLGCTLSDCIISLFGKILEHEIFELKVGTLKMNPILEDIQTGHKK